jgi:cobalt-precorrin-5B (C1)-methyltransferase
MLFIAQARPTKSGVSLTFGDGIGRWNRTTPRYHIGDPAVSPQARDVIQTAIEEALQKIGLGGVEICILPSMVARLPQRH